MGTSERCPKCKGRLIYDGGGYGRARGEAGVARTTLPESYTCINCGKYIEVFTEATPVAEEFKAVTKYQNSNTRAEYSNVGSLQSYVNQNYDKIMKLKQHLSWEEIAIEIGKRLGKDLLVTTLRSSCKRVRRVNERV